MKTLEQDPVYQSANVEYIDFIGIASYNDDNGRTPIHIYYSVNHNREEITVYKVSAPPFDFDSLLDDVVWSMNEEIKGKLINHYTKYYEI